MILENRQIAVEFWGDYACFSAPYARVERMTYPAPTPTAAIGMLSAIYCKKSEFYWEIDRIEVLNPIRYISIQRNEVKKKVNRNLDYLCVDETGKDGTRTQRQTIAVADVRYRIVAHIVPRENYKNKIDDLYKQAERRIRTGQCYYQPAMGLREFVAYFEMSDGTRTPIPVDFDMGWVVHDLWDMHDWKSKTGNYKVKRTMFHCFAKQGVISVPPRGANVIKQGGI